MHGGKLMRVVRIFLDFNVLFLRILLIWPANSMSDIFDTWLSILIFESFKDNIVCYLFLNICGIIASKILFRLQDLAREFQVIFY